MSLTYNVRQCDLLNSGFQTISIMSATDLECAVTAVTDAKSLYDAVIKEQFSAQEKRAALEVCVIRDSLKALNGQMRWVPPQ